MSYEDKLLNDLHLELNSQRKHLTHSSGTPTAGARAVVTGGFPPPAVSRNNSSSLNQQQQQQQQQQQHYHRTTPNGTFLPEVNTTGSSNSSSRTGSSSSSTGRFSNHQQQGQTSQHQIRKASSMHNSPMPEGGPDSQRLNASANNNTSNNSSCRSTPRTLSGWEMERIQFLAMKQEAVEEDEKTEAHLLRTQRDLQIAKQGEESDTLCSLASLSQLQTSAAFTSSSAPSTPARQTSPVVVLGPSSFRRLSQTTSPPSQQQQQEYQEGGQDVWGYLSLDALSTSTFANGGSGRGSRRGSSSGILNGPADFGTSILGNPATAVPSSGSNGSGAGGKRVQVLSPSEGTGGVQTHDKAQRVLSLEAHLDRLVESGSSGSSTVSFQSKNITPFIISGGGRRSGAQQPSPPGSNGPTAGSSSFRRSDTRMSSTTTGSNSQYNSQSSIIGIGGGSGSGFEVPTLPSGALEKFNNPEVPEDTEAGARAVTVVVPTTSNSIIPPPSQQQLSSPESSTTRRNGEAPNGAKPSPSLDDVSRQLDMLVDQA